MQSQKLLLRFLLLVLVIIATLSLSYSPARSASCEDSCDDKSGDAKLSCLSEVKAACEAKLSEISEKKRTLRNEIDYLNTQIALTQSRINETTYLIEQLEGEIVILEAKIDDLTASLDAISRLLLQRITATYKQTKVHPLSIFFSASGMQEMINRYRYLKSVQLNDRRMLFEMELARNDYDNQKKVKEEKQNQVLGLRDELLVEKGVQDRQRKEKQFVLSVTANDERKYQELLQKARAELLAIQAIIAGQGDETEVREAGEGEKIATIMTSGPNLYACSTGPHLHFEVVKSQTAQNPFNLLQGKSLIWDNADPQQQGSGSWRWPLEDPIRITQGFGSTSYSSRYAGGIHTGIDMVNDSNREVKAVRKGKLFRGSIDCRGGKLQYVRVKHAEDEYDTYYLHVDYF